MFHSRSSGFTLIELLIVVAIIAILAAIAVPNFLEAQVRAKATRNKNDMRSLATAMEAYKLDQNRYPPDMVEWWLVLGRDYNQRLNLLFVLTTPVSYISSVPRNVFVEKSNWTTRDDPRLYIYEYSAEGTRTWHLGQYAPGSTAIGAPTTPNAIVTKHGIEPAYWSIGSVGPDMTYNHVQWYLFGEPVMNDFGPVGARGGYGCLYDATNGTISAGDIGRRGP